MSRILVVAVITFAAADGAAADDVTEKARAAYEVGLKLFDAGQREQALIEFKRAYEWKPRPAIVFMMAQCEYLLGDLKAAREHYDGYMRESPAGDFVALAKDRIDSIEKRPSTFVINTFPDGVDVKLSGERGIFTGQAPNNFAVPRGRYTLTLSRKNHATQTHDVEIGLAETKSRFFQLRPIPARLEITTEPPNARLFVNGSLARNPYKQDVDPGRYEIYAESSESPPQHEPLPPTVVELGPGERRIFDEAHDGALSLKYRQRSGKVELVVWSSAITAALGTGVVYASLRSVNNVGDAAPVTLVAAGGVVGGLVGMLGTSLAVPRYIPDNKALFIIGGMWIGGVQGGALALTLSPGTWALFAGRSDGAELPPLLFGAVGGVGVGTAAAILLRERAPTYGRVSLVQSAAVIGLLSGALVNTALERGDRAMGASLLTGLNVGLGVGLAAAYLPNQNKYGPSWRRVILVDLAAGTGALAGAISATVRGCIEAEKTGKKAVCEFLSAPRTAQLTLLGGYLGLAAGVFFTRNLDAGDRSPPAAAKPARARIPIPAPTALAVETTRGGAALIPGVAAVGRF